MSEEQDIAQHELDEQLKDAGKTRPRRPAVDIDLLRKREKGE